MPASKLHTRDVNIEFSSNPDIAFENPV